MCQYVSCLCLQVIDENSSSSTAVCKPFCGAPTPQAQSWLTPFMPIADILFPVICTALSICWNPLESSFLVTFCSWLLHFGNSGSPDLQSLMYFGAEVLHSDMSRQTCLMVFEDLLYSCCRRMSG